MVIKHPHKVPIHHGDNAKHLPIKDAPHGRQLRFGAFAALTAPGQALAGKKTSNVVLGVAGVSLQGACCYTWRHLKDIGNRNISQYVLCVKMEVWILLAIPSGNFSRGWQSEIPYKSRFELNKSSINGGCSIAMFDNHGE